MFTRPVTAHQWSVAENFIGGSLTLSSQATPATLFYDDADLLKYYSSFQDLPATLRRAGIPSGFETILSETLLHNPQNLSRLASLVAQAKSLAYISLVFPCIIAALFIPAAFIIFPSVALVALLAVSGFFVSLGIYQKFCPSVDDVSKIFYSPNTQLYDMSGKVFFLSCAAVCCWSSFASLVVILEIL